MLRARAVQVKVFLLDSAHHGLHEGPLIEGVRTMPKDDKPRGLPLKRGAPAPAAKTTKKTAKKR